jgi:recombination protein RecT
MAVTNSLTKQPPAKPKFSVVIQQDAYKNLVNNTLGDQKRAQRFIAAVSSAVAVNPALQECEAGSILSGALLGEALNLSPSPQLGQY